LKLILKKTDKIIVGELHFLTLTRLIKRKNIANVLKSLKILKERGLKFHYTIAGKGKNMNILLNSQKIYISKIALPF